MSKNSADNDYLLDDDDDFDSMEIDEAMLQQLDHPASIGARTAGPSWRAVEDYMEARRLRKELGDFYDEF